MDGTRPLGAGKRRRGNAQAANAIGVELYTCAEGSFSRVRHLQAWTEAPLVHRWTCCHTNLASRMTHDVRRRLPYRLIAALTMQPAAQHLDRMQDCRGGFAEDLLHSGVLKISQDPDDVQQPDRRHGVCVSTFRKLWLLPNRHTGQQQMKLLLLEPRGTCSYANAR